jgi:hypothetical protein
VTRRLNAQSQQVVDRVVSDIRDSQKRLVETRLFDHPDDRHTEPVVCSEYLEAAAGLLRADLRAVVAEELTEAGASIRIVT